MNRIGFYIIAGTLLAAIFVAARFVLAPTKNAPEISTPQLGVLSPTTAPTIGGPFRLVDQDGQEVTDETYRGKYMLVYFGYTFCPDVCPTSLSAMADTLDILGKLADDIVPIFISVDHQRDTPEHLKEYVKYFYPTLQGLSGSAENITAAAKAYRVYYTKVIEEGADPDDYLMDHTSIIYLMGRDGSFKTHFGHGASPQDMARKIKEVIDGEASD